MNEVDRPSSVRPRLDQDGRARAGSPLASLSLAHHQALLAIQPLGLLAVHDMAFITQQDVQPPIAEPPLLGGQLAQAPAQVLVRRPAGSVADRLAIGPDQASSLRTSSRIWAPK